MLRPVPDTQKEIRENFMVDFFSLVILYYRIFPKHPEMGGGRRLLNDLLDLRGYTHTGKTEAWKRGKKCWK